MLRGVECEGKLKRLQLFSLKKEVIVRRWHIYKTKAAGGKTLRKYLFITSPIRRARHHLKEGLGNQL